MLNPKWNYEKIVMIHRVLYLWAKHKNSFLGMYKEEFNILCNLCLCMYVLSNHLLKNLDTFKDYEYSLFFNMASLIFKAFLCHFFPVSYVSYAECYHCDHRKHISMINHKIFCKRFTYMNKVKSFITRVRSFRRNH